jgi:hypothetical protein
MTNVSYSGNNHKEARSSSQPDISCKILSVNEDDKADLADDGKLGYGFTSADELEEVDIGPGDKPRPTFISKKFDPSL